MKLIMNVSHQLSKHFKEVHTGGNWTCSNVKDVIADITYAEAITKVYSCNTIISLVFHVNYYVVAVNQVLLGGKLEASDKLSYAHTEINSAEDWIKLKTKVIHDAIEFSDLIEKLPDSRLLETFIDEKYGMYFRNIIGIIEHTHYHLGQIALLKKIIREKQ